MRGDPRAVAELLCGWLERQVRPAATLFAADGEDFLRLCVALRPDLIVLAAEPPAWRASALLARLRAQRAPPAAVTVALHSGVCPTALRMLRAAGFDELVDGAHGATALFDALDRLLRRVGPQVLGASAAALPDLGADRPAEAVTGGPSRTAAGALRSTPLAPLTAREAEVLSLVGRGLRSGDIAARLGISARTVENHKRHLLAKLKVHSEAHAVALAVRAGLLVPGPATGPALTPREREILALAAAGLSVKQTAHVLGVAVKTVESLQRQLFRKLGVRGRADALVATGVYQLPELAPQPPVSG